MNPLAFLLHALVGEPTSDADQQTIFVGPSGQRSKVGDFLDENGDLKAGLLVAVGTNDEDVALTGDGDLDAIGWVEHRVKDNEILLASGSDTYTADDLVSVISGKQVLARLANGENVTKDTRLVPAASGTVRAYVDQGQTSPDDPAAIVGRAAESVNASGGEDWIVVHSFID